MKRVSESGLSDGSGSDREPFFFGTFFDRFLAVFFFVGAIYPNTAQISKAKKTTTAAAT